MSKTLSSILHIGAPVSGSGSAVLSDSPVISSKLDTTSTSFDLVNTSASTVNFAGAATTLALASTTGTTTIRNNLNVAGNITFGGGANQLSATNLSVDDALIYLAANNVADIIDIGWIGGYQPASTHLHTGLVRDATDKVWKLFSGVSAEPTTTVDFTGASYDNLRIGGLTATAGAFSGQLTSTVATGTAPFAVTSTTPVSNLNIGGYSSALKSATTVIDVASATAPSNGQVLTATSSTTAEWKTIGGGTGTVTLVGGTGTVNGLTLTGSVSSSGNLTLGGTLSNVSLASAVTGTLPVANGGTGVATITGLLKGNGTAAVTAASAGTDYVAPGGVLGTPTSGTLTACTGLPIVGGTTGTLTIARGGTGSTATTYCSLTTNVTGTLPVANGGTGSTTLTFPAGTASIGYLNIPQVSQSANYTCVLSDSGKHILHPATDTTERTFTIPSNASVAYPVGTVLVFVNEHAAGTVTIQIDTDNLYLAGSGTNGTRTLSSDGIATAIKTSATNWLISGTNLA